MSDEDEDIEALLARMAAAEVVDADAAAASVAAAAEVDTELEGETAPEEPPAPSLPIVVELSDEVSSTLEQLAKALSDFNTTAAAYLTTNRLDVAGIAGDLEPAASASEVDASEALVAAWSATPDAQLAALRGVVSGMQESRQAANDYVVKMKEVFANAIVPEPPAEETTELAASS